MKKLNIPKKKIDYYNKLGIDTTNKRFRNRYKEGLLDNIDEEYINEIQQYYKKHYKETIDPITHITFTNLTGIKDVRVLPEIIFRKELLKVFNDYPLTDIYRDKALYDLLFDTPNQAYNVIKRIRGQYYSHDNVPISYNEMLTVLKNDSDEYIIKPTDTNNGIGIKKLIVKNNSLIIDEQTINSAFINQEYGYNFVVQRLIKQHEDMAYLHPSSVNTLRMATMRWNNRIENIYTFARFGHSGEIKDNAGAGGVVVGVKNNGEFMDYGVQDSKIIDNHPTTNIKISELTAVPNYNEAKAFVRELHSKILHHNYVAWDISIDQNGIPIYIECNFFGNSWTNQLALQQPMLGEHTETMLEFIAENKSKVNELDTKSLAKKNRIRSKIKQSKLKNEIKKTNTKLEKEKIKRKKIGKKLKVIKDERHDLTNDIKRMKNSRSWRYTRLLRKK